MTLYTHAGLIVVAAGGAALSAANVLTHGSAATVNGSGFVVNSNDLQWDHGQNGVGNLYSGWQFALPSPGAVPSQYVLQNQTGPFTLNGATVNGPYARVPNFLAGTCYNDNAGADSRIVQVSVNLDPVPSTPYCSYWSYRFCQSNAWQFGLGSPADDNQKWYVYSETNSGPFGAPPYWYWGTNNGIGGPTSNVPTTLAGEIINAGGSFSGGPQFPDQNSHSAFWGSCPSPFNSSVGWIHVEIVARWSQGTDGFWKRYENGNLVVNYAGPTTFNSGSSVVNEAIILPYTRDYASSPATSPDNGAYAADIQYWNSGTNTVNAQRLMMSSSSSWSPGSGIVAEPQYPVSGGGASYSFIVNGGSLADGNVYLYQVDEVQGTSTKLPGTYILQG
jgi:hypothetical protein